MSTWEHEDPKLWAELPNAFGPDWQSMTLDAMYGLMETRVKANQCSWCGKALGEVLTVSPMFPSIGPFCRNQCGDFDLRFYCIVEGK